VGYIFTFENYTVKNNNLYHSTNLDSLFVILFSNKLAGATPQEINGEMFRGVSCSYDKNYIYRDSDITLELNSLLKDKYKTYEVNFFETNFGKQRQKQHNIAIEDEKEIFVVTGSLDKETSLKPLSKYLVSIKLNKEGMRLPEDVKELLETNYSKIKIYNHKGKDITKTIIKNPVGIGFDGGGDFIGGFNDFDLY
jgi:hypothetical protein